MADSLKPAARPLVALVADATPTGPLRSIMRSLGVGRVFEARDGAEALDLLTTRRPDLLVLDWDLPIVTASDILEHARDATRSHAPDMPILLTMTSPTRSAVETALGMKAAIVAKPFSPNALRVRLAPMLQGAA